MTASTLRSANKMKKVHPVAVEHQSRRGVQLERGTLRRSKSAHSDGSFDEVGPDSMATKRPRSSSVPLREVSEYERTSQRDSRVSVDAGVTPPPNLPTIPRDASPLSSARVQIVDPPQDFSSRAISMKLEINGKLYRLSVRGPADPGRVFEAALNSSRVAVLSRRLGITSSKSIDLHSNGSVRFKQSSLRSGEPANRQLATVLNGLPLDQSLDSLTLEHDGGLVVGIGGRDLRVKPSDNRLRDVHFLQEDGTRAKCVDHMVSFARHCALALGSSVEDPQPTCRLEGQPDPVVGAKTALSREVDSDESKAGDKGKSIGKTAEALRTWLAAECHPGSQPRVVDPLVSLQVQRGQTCKLYGTSVAMWQRYHAKRSTHSGLKAPPMARKGDARELGLPAETSLRQAAKEKFGSKVGEVYTGSALVGLANHFGFSGTQLLEPSPDEYIDALKQTLDQNKPAVVFFEVDVRNGQPVSLGGTWEHAAVVCGYYYDKAGDLKFVVAQWGEFYVHDARSLRDSAGQLKEVRDPESFIKIPQAGWQEFEALREFHGVDAATIPEHLKAKMKIRHAEKPTSGLRNKILVVDYDEA